MSGGDLESCKRVQVLKESFRMEILLLQMACHRTTPCSTKCIAGVKGTAISSNDFMHLIDNTVLC